MEILIVCDNGVKEEHFRAGFRGLEKEHKIRIVELNRGIVFLPLTESEKKIREFIGSPKQLVREVEHADVLVVNYAPVTAEVMDADENLRLIGVTRGGPVNVDLSAAAERGIQVVNAPERSVESAADFTIALMLAEVRQIARSCYHLKSGKEFKVNPRLFPDATIIGWELAGKTLGIVGLGRIGKKVALRAKSFGMEILCYDPYVSREEAEKVGAELVDLNALLTRADVITLHVRLTPETRRMIGKEQLALMKKSCYLVNTSRGGVVDENALYHALKDKKIAGAALDVVEEEPIKLSNPLLRLDNVTITPHMAGITRDVPLKSASMIAEEVAKFITGEPLTRLVPV